MNSNGTPDELFPRLGTGNAALDEILHGGLPANSLNIIMGHPGTGKTVLAQQMLFHNAHGDRPVLYIATLSEPLSKVITYLQRFSFYDESAMGSRIIYEDLSQELMEHGVDSLVKYLKQSIREVEPMMIVIDSFKVLHDLEPSATKMRHLMVDLAGTVAAYETTTLLVGEYDTEEIPTRSEFAVVDGVIQLQRLETGKHDERFLGIIKLRGTDYQEGMHAFAITPDGLDIHPRLVTPAVPEAYEPLVERVATGIPGLDGILNGGLWRGSTTLVSGPEGAGKTTFGLAFAMEGVRNGQPSAFLNFQEDPSQMARTISSLGIDLQAALDGGLHLLYESPVELQIDSLVGRLFRLIEEEGIQRVVIDAAGDLALAARDRGRFHDYLYSMFRHFAARKVTAVISLEKAPAPSEHALTEQARFASMTDAIIELAIDLRETPRRLLRVAKARAIDHDLRPHEMIIHSGGIRLVEEDGGDE